MPGNRQRLKSKQAQALRHPLRLRILELFTRGPARRPLTASTFFPDLAGEFDELTLSQVGYHLAQLQDAELLPP